MRPWTKAGLVVVILAGAIQLVAAEPPPAEKVERKGPLATLPSAPGPTVEKIKALGDNEWLNLGSPAADPQWGKARGRAWSSRMAYAPDLKAAFIMGEGVHCWWNKQNNRYMDDLFVYDVYGHRWVCAYPGTDVKNVDLKLDANGFEVDRDGRPTPIAQLGHGYEMQTYDPDLKRFMFMPGASGDWQAAAPFGAKRKAWGVSYQGMPKSHSPWLYDVQTGRWDMKKVPGPNPYRGATTLGSVLVYVPGLKKAFFFAGYDEVAFYDPAATSWEVIKRPSPAPPFGIDAVACLDPGRSRIYVGGVCGKPNAFWYYDLKARAWVDPQPQGKPFKGENHFTTNRSAMNFDSANDVAVVCCHLTGAEGKAKGIHVYDPKDNKWAEEALALPSGFYPGKYATCVSSFYCPDLNAHFFHVAGDSADDGIMWVYRYKRAEKK